MKENSFLTNYTSKEEKWHIGSHGFGVLLSFFAYYLLLEKAKSHPDLPTSLGLLIYGLGLVLMYFTSTLYHLNKVKRLDRFFNKLDHVSIYLLMACTFIPIAFSSQVANKWNIIIVVLSVVGIAIALKLFSLRKTYKVSTYLYIMTGCVGMAGAYVLSDRLPLIGVVYLTLGGVVYAIGSMLHIKRSIRYNHTYFHFCVLIASILHFITIYKYL